MTHPQNVSILYRGFKADINALTDVPEGSIAYALDFNEHGTFNGSEWEWDLKINNELSNGDSIRWDSTDNEFKAYAPVIGAISSVSGNLVSFSNTSGKSLADSGILATNVVIKTVLSGRVFVPFGVFSSINPMSTTSAPYAATIDRTMTLKNFSVTSSVAGTNNGTNYWTIKLVKTITGATIKQFDTSAVTYTDGYFLHTSATFDVSSVGSADKGMYIVCTKVNAPGNLYLFGPLLEVEI